MLYIPPAFKVTDAAPLIRAIDAHGFATLISNSPDGPVITPLPLLFDAAGGPLGRLIGHVARANPHWHIADLARPSLALFHGPEAYVSPGWYPSKAETGKAVPTWNYSLIHVQGQLTIHDDADWLRDVVSRLTNRHEAGRSVPWTVEEAPEGFIAAQLRGIVGVELVITAIEGKDKLSQNRSVPDRAGVIAGLAGEPDGAGAGILRLMSANPAPEPA